MDESVEENLENNNDCDNNASPIGEISCQFFKCEPKQTVDSNDDEEEDKSVNKHNLLKRTTNEVDVVDKCEASNSSSQIDLVPTYFWDECVHDNSNCANCLFAKQTEDGTWMLRWKIENEQEGDFIALGWLGKFILSFCLFYLFLLNLFSSHTRPAINELST